MKDYLFFALGVSPIVAFLLGLAALNAGLTSLFTVLAAYSITASVGCLRLLHEFWAHGIHNDR